MHTSFPLIIVIDIVVALNVLYIHNTTHFNLILQIVSRFTETQNVLVKENNND